MVFKSRRKSMKINKCLLKEIGISKDFTARKLDKIDKNR